MCLQMDIAHFHNITSKTTPPEQHNNKENKSRLGYSRLTD